MKVCPECGDLVYPTEKACACGYVWPVEEQKTPLSDDRSKKFIDIEELEKQKFDVVRLSATNYRSKSGNACVRLNFAFWDHKAVSHYYVIGGKWTNIK